MNIDYGKLKIELMKFGLDEKRSVYFCEKMEESFSVGGISNEEAQWALRRGFLPDRVSLYGLSDDNYRDYLSDFDYFMMHPLNNHFRIWVNDKLTLKYMLSGTKMDRYMPEYYLYIENDGHYTYLENSPSGIDHNQDYLFNLLREKKVLACKPNNGAGGKGFIKFEWVNDRIYQNGKAISQAEFQNVIGSLDGYIVTEYISQHVDLGAIWNKGTSTLRVIVVKAPDDNRYVDVEYKVIVPYIRFGTSVSNCACNLTSGGIGVAFDYETGRLADIGVRYRHMCSNAKWKILEHPDTRINFGKIILPYHSEIRQCISSVCKYLSSLDFFGFDIIITNTGVKICEINTLPSIDYEQVMCGPILRNKDAQMFFKHKKKKEYPKNALWSIVEKCIQ